MGAMRADELTCRKAVVLGLKSKVIYLIGKKTDCGRRLPVADSFPKTVRTGQTKAGNLIKVSDVGDRNLIILGQCCFPGSAMSGSWSQDSEPVSNKDSNMGHRLLNWEIGRAHV